MSAPPPMEMEAGAVMHNQQWGMCDAAAAAAADDDGGRRQSKHVDGRGAM